MQITPAQSSVISEEVQALFEKHAIYKVQNSNIQTETQFISPLFTVPKKGGGHRPVINLKDLNYFVEYQHFKMEGVTMLKDLLKPNDFMTKIDLKDAYLTVPIWHKHKKFLRFLWKDTLWEFACLPFGLATLPKDKIKGIMKDCHRILNNPYVSVRTLSRLIGKLSASIQAIFPAPLHYQSLLRAKNIALRQSQSYEVMVSLNQAAQEELHWWKDHLAAWNGKSLLKRKEDLTIETDASNLGWGELAAEC
ncbi:uncharacterized protein LOC114530788 [Dendronephthya gigantea]|uniref:uncharacterized protein LOC114530788 n=1 Tax=Dendronephthya gigantea TaxID=151771 RepID=UPI00106C8A9F|nr:uncharacterized protein LOC114530788 [Dendronephthya gigantea]